MHTEFWWVNLFENVQLEERGDEWITFKCILGRQVARLRVLEVYVIGLRSCPMTGFAISSVEHLNSSIRELCKKSHKLSVLLSEL
jgi:hypothetical protein